jgi:PAT family beta-lactamase induction signal transducer AmpG
MKSEMIEDSLVIRSWQETFLLFFQREVITMLFLGFSAGIPILLLFSPLSLWLSEAGVSRSTVTYFSWAALGYSFKFLWAPLVDSLPLPFLTRWLGRRRSWILFTQLLIIAAIVTVGSIDPSLGVSSLTMMAFAVVLLGFSSATQDAVIDAYRIEIAKPDLQALMASTYIAGYRIGMIVAGAGTLILAQSLGSSPEEYRFSAWQWTYYTMALVMLVGVITTLVIIEPINLQLKVMKYNNKQYLKFLMLFVVAILVFIISYSSLSNLIEEAKSQLNIFINNITLVSLLMEFTRLCLCLLNAIFALWLFSKTPLYERELVKNTYVLPIKDFFNRYGKKAALIILLFIGLYRISDIVLGVMALVFYQDMGFSKIEIATATKTFGLLMTILGGFLGGVLTIKYGVFRILFLGAILTILTNLLFVLLARSGHDLPLLYAVISADNITNGLASAVLIAYMASLVNISFTTVQYAILSSLMTLLPKTVGGYSGSMVESMGYENFFLIASAMGIPVLFILHRVKSDALKR